MESCPRRSAEPLTLHRTTEPLHPAEVIGDAAAVAFAEAGAWEPVEDLTRFVYSERRTA